jgi:hypothetical protein
MGLADGIRKHGFRKWYERELLQSHAHLVLTFLCTIGLFAGFELLDGRAPALDQLADLLTILLCAAVGVWALRRYLFLLTHAEATANQAECPRCKTYARFTLVAENRSHDAVEVCCRKCEQRWTISE